MTASSTPACPECLSGSQVWYNPVSGTLTCHRWGCSGKDLRQSADFWRKQVIVWPDGSTVTQEQFDKLLDERNYDH